MQEERNDLEWRKRLWITQTWTSKEIGNGLINLLNIFLHFNLTYKRLILNL